MSFIRTSKILFKPNYTNRVKLDELSNFLDLCSDALNFYVVYFARYYQLDKLLFVHSKHKNNKIFDSNSNLTKLNSIFYDLIYDKEKNKYKFSLKLKFYPDEILKANAASIHYSIKDNSAAKDETIFSVSSDSDDTDDSLDQKFRLILSARTLKSVKTQAMGIIRSWVQQILQSYQFGYFNRDKYKKSHRKNIRKYCDDKRKVVKNLIRGAGKKDSKLKINKFEFNSVNCQLLRAGIDDSFELSEYSNFDLLFSFHSMYTKEYSRIKLRYPDRKNKLHIPLRLRSHKHFNELKSGIVANTECKHEDILKSFLVSKDGIEVRFKFKSTAKESQFKSNLVGIDQGQRKLFSAIYVNDKSNNKDIDCYLTEKNLKEQLQHGYNEVCNKIARRQKGSKGFKRAQEHRKNLINQAVNLLAQIFNFEDDVAEVRLEKLRRLGEGKKKSRKLQAFNYADLRHKIERKCIETNVELTETSNAYRSQRCSLCGFVHSKNRLNGCEEFKCLKCGYTADADMNSAKNQVAKIPPIYVSRQNRNKASLPNHTTGFYWL